LKDAQLNASLQNGILNISRIVGALDKGSLNGNILIKAQKAGQPIDIESSFNLKDANVASVTKLVTGKTSSRLNGGMQLDVDMSATGVSSAALISALNGKGRVQIIEPVLQGLNARALYDTVKSIDSFQGAISGMLQSGTSSGSTQFNSVDKEFSIINGVIPIENWDAKSNYAVLVSDGVIDFPNWKIDVKNTVQIEGNDNLPSFGMRIHGPLDAPQTSVTDQAIEGFLQSKIGDRVKDVITDKLISEKLQGKVKDKLGVGLEDVLPFGKKSTPSENADTSSEQQDQSLEKQLLKGLFNELSK
jgi:uncharacterized protein involved in outer membrane biogenesis